MRGENGTAAGPKTTDLNRARRKLALALAEAIVARWDGMEAAGFDVDDATDLIAALLPATRAEAEAEMEAVMRDDPQQARADRKRLDAVRRTRERHLHILGESTAATQMSAYFADDALAFDVPAWRLLLGLDGRWRLERIRRR